MSKRKVKYKENEFIKPCHKCGNNTEFTIHSEYCAEDCCEIWAVCKCGYDPTNEEGGFGNRVEDIWGGCSAENCQDAIRYAWNETLEIIDR